MASLRSPRVRTNSDGELAPDELAGHLFGLADDDAHHPGFDSGFEVADAAGSRAWTNPLWI